MIQWIIRLIGGGILEKVIDAFTKSEDIRIQGKQIDADVAKEAMKAYVETQKMESSKWSQWWFPLMAAPFVFSIGMFFLLLTLYNVFWHPNGIFPQDWTIAAYPGVYQEWATQAFNFIFAPVIGIAALKALLK